MCRRLLVVTIVATAIASLSPVVSSAGGWDTLNFPRDHYLVGQVAHTRDEFFAGALKGTGALDGGPYYAYLLPERGSRSFAMIEPPTIPNGSIRLGSLRIDGPIVRDGYRYAVASLTFTVPEVPSGRYTIGFCDDPCTHSTVGFLAWGWITIVHTTYEAALLGRLDRQRTQRWALKNEARKAVRASKALRVTLGRAQAALQTPRFAAVSAEGSASVSVSARPARGGSALWWLMLLAALLGVVVGALIGRPRRTRIRNDISDEPVIAQGARAREHADV